MSDTEVEYVIWNWNFHQLKLKDDAFFIFANAVKRLVIYIGFEQKRIKKTVFNVELVISVFS